MSKTARESDEDEPSIESRAAGGFKWALVGFLLTQIGSFGTYSVATKILGDSGIGVVATALTLVFWVDILLDLGMGASIIYEQEKGRSERVEVAFTVNAFVSTLLAVSVFLGAPLIDDFFGTGNVGMFRIVALLILAKGMNQVPDALLKREMDFKRRSRADLIRSIGRFGISTGLLLAGYGPVSMIIGVTIAEVAAVSFTWWLVAFRPRLRVDMAIAIEMLKFGGAVFAARLVGMLWLNGDYLVVSHHFSGKSKEFGSYFTAFRLPELVLGSVYNLFSNVAFPAYAKARDEGPEKLRQASLVALKWLCLFGFTAGIGMSLIARDFITWWFGSKFTEAIMPMQLLCIAGGFVAVGFASGDVYAAIGRPRLALYFSLIGAPILIGGFLAVVDRGIVAVACVHVAVIVPYAAIRIEVANRLLGTTWPQSLLALRPAVASIVGMVALGLPVRLSTEAGFASFCAVLAAGAVGAALGVAVGDRTTFGEIVAGAKGAVAKFAH